MKDLKSIFDWASLYISQGWQVVPLAPGSKACKDDGWLQLIFKPEDFDPHDNIGIRSVNGLVIVDLDAPEAVACADDFLPATGAIYGRPSKSRSKRLYASTFPKTIAFRDTENNSTLLEVRSQHQDMAPPSVHPDGEHLTWHGTIGQVGMAEPAILMRALQLNATCALISRYYAASGARHEWCLALAGTLKQLGLTQVEADKVLSAAGRFAGDGKVPDRLTEVRTTYNKGDDDHVKGSKALREASSKSFLTSLTKIWGGASSAFLLDEKGDKILANSQENIRRALDKLDARLVFNSFSQRPLVSYNGNTGTLQDDVRDELWLTIDQKFHFRPAPDFFDVVIQNTARKTTFHPVRTYLDKLEWDGEKRLSTWLVRLAGAADSEYVQAVSQIVLTAAVRRVRQPGCKFDELLVLESPEGKDKSTALLTLCYDEAWFSDDLPLNVDSKQVIERSSGKWIIEAAELAGMHPSRADHLRAMLSRRVDGPVRMAYARLPVEVKRQFIVIGTTNSHSYLKSKTGNRRYWPVRIKNFNLEKLRGERDQLWAEASHSEALGTSIRLPPRLYAQAELQQERRRADDVWEEAIASNFKIDEKHRVTGSEVWDKLGIPMSQRSEKDQSRIADIMQRLGFRRLTVSHKGVKVRGWARDPGDQLSFEDKIDGSASAD